jgi:hypothetical protein
LKLHFNRYEAMYLRAATDVFRPCEYHLYTPRTGEVDPFFQPEPSYFLVPANLVSQWHSEIRRFFGDFFKLYVYYSTKRLAGP